MQIIVSKVGLFYRVLNGIKGVEMTLLVSHPKTQQT